MIRKIQKTYEKYLDKKMKANRKPRISKEFKDEMAKKDCETGSVSWKYVTYEDLDMIDLG